MKTKFKSISLVLAAALLATALSVVGAAAAPVRGDNTPPLVYGVTVAPSPATLGDVITVSAVVNDSGNAGSRLESAKFSVDGGNWSAMTPFDGDFNTPAEGVSGRFTVKRLGTHEVCVKAVDAAGNASEAACTTLDAQSEIGFGGFFPPVSNDGNHVQAGHVVPLDWAMVDADNKPIYDRSAFRGVWSYEVDCGNRKGDPHSAVQEVGRFNQTLVSALTSGEWTALWRPQKAYADSCRMVFVKFSDGSRSPAVLFRFR